MGTEEKTDEHKKLVNQLFKNNNIAIPANRVQAFNSFLEEEESIAAIEKIIENSNVLMRRWKFKERVSEIIAQPIRVLNATVGKPYETKFDFSNFKWTDISDFHFVGLTEVGLMYDERTKQLTGIPTQSGDHKILFKFKIEGQSEEEAYNEKALTLIVNPDPKSLWKNIESDKTDPYWKENDVTVCNSLGEKHILVSSKRGRSHANVGSFREDDFAFSDLPDGWNIVVVADGAGSAKLSRKGSAIACSGIVEYFKEEESGKLLQEFDGLLQQHEAESGEQANQKINHFVYNTLGKAAFNIHKQLEAFAANGGVPLKDLNTTLIFTLFKKYDIGYALLSFGVGDCPIAVLNKEVTEVHLMNWLDVGEFGGGTRFITMPEIFQNEKFATRFGFKLIDDFSYLIMMSDGIYDPKFVVESNLPDIKKWKEFLSDLGGKNEDNAVVELSITNKEIEQQFSSWMDFWSPGNHDDRTLAIVF